VEHSLLFLFGRPVSEHTLLWQPTDCTTKVVLLILLQSEINMMMRMMRMMMMMMMYGIVTLNMYQTLGQLSGGVVKYFRPYP